MLIRIIHESGLTEKAAFHLREHNCTYRKLGERWIRKVGE